MPLAAEEEGAKKRQKQPDHSPCPTPKRAVQGFVVYLLTTAAFALYLVWLVVPEEVLRDSLGVTFFPQRYWAVAIPIYLSVAFMTFVFVVYPSLGLIRTPPLKGGDLRYIIDSHSVFNEDSFDSCGESKEAIAKIADIHPAVLVATLKNSEIE